VVVRIDQFLSTALAFREMNAFNLTIVILAIGVMVVACLGGICSLFFGKRDK
jgi:hypothetical protein